ncbi:MULTISPECIES: BrnA antitoxin family protein [Rhodopseudomonas]|uniref:BrnA antitoxin family protein n=1 Tax=Rhodopseudomonas TaxID=1073 RepID=UPI001FCEC18C|nr:MULTISPECIES: BrnA antitoxin family protein [Rhodopseudomonas]
MTDDPDDAPELLDEFFRTGEIRVDGKIVRRGRPPLGAQPKSSVTLRLDADVLDAYRALGRGWQSQINADLRRVRKLKKA